MYSSSISRNPPTNQNSIAQARNLTPTDSWRQTLELQLSPSQLDAFGKLLNTPAHKRSFSAFCEAGMLSRLDAESLLTIKDPRSGRDAKEVTFVLSSPFAECKALFDTLKSSAGRKELADVLSILPVRSDSWKELTPTYDVTIIERQYLRHHRGDDSVHSIFIHRAGPVCGIKLFDCKPVLDYLRSNDTLREWSKLGSFPPGSYSDQSSSHIVTALIGSAVLAPHC